MARLREPRLTLKCQSACDLYRASANNGGLDEAINGSVCDGDAGGRLDCGATHSRCCSESYDKLSGLPRGVYHLYAEGADTDGSRRLPRGRADVRSRLYQLVTVVR